MSRRKGIMLCYPFEEKRLFKWEPPYLVQPKYDGDRCVTQKFSNGRLLLSSEENVFSSVPHIQDAIDKLGSYLPDLDGELYDHDLYLQGGHELIYSIVSRTSNLHPDYQQIKFHLFDTKDKESLQFDRIKTLLDLKRSLPPELVVSPLWVCNSLDEVKKIYDKLISQNYEGIIVRHINGPYVERRSTYIMKFKPKRSDTYTIIGWNEERTITGIPKGRVGSLILSSGDSTFSVGAGLNADQKEFLFNLGDSIIGLEAIVFYQHLTNRQIPKGTFDIKIPALGV